MGYFLSFTFYFFAFRFAFFINYPFCPAGYGLLAANPENLPNEYSLTLGMK